VSHAWIGDSEADDIQLKVQELKDYAKFKSPSCFSVPLFKGRRRLMTSRNCIVREDEEVGYHRGLQRASGERGEREEVKDKMTGCKVIMTDTICTILTIFN